MNTPSDSARLTGGLNAGANTYLAFLRAAGITPGR